MSLKYKLILFCLAISILPLAVTAVVSMRQAGGILGEQAFAGLEAARDSRKQALEALQPEMAGSGREFPWGALRPVWSSELEGGLLALEKAASPRPETLQEGAPGREGPRPGSSPHRDEASPTGPELQE